MTREKTVWTATKKNCLKTIIESGVKDPATMARVLGAAYGIELTKEQVANHLYRERTTGFYPPTVGYKKRKPGAAPLPIPLDPYEPVPLVAFRPYPLPDNSTLLTDIEDMFH